MKTPISRLRTIAILEGISFIVLLFIAMPLKYMAGIAIAVRVAGSLHGLLFVLLVFSLAEMKVKNNWEMDKLGKVFVASLIPFGTFIIDKDLKKEELTLNNI